MREPCQCEEGLARASVWLEGVLLPLTGVLGLAGNGLAVMVFRSVRRGRGRLKGEFFQKISESEIHLLPSTDSVSNCGYSLYHHISR